MTLLTELTRLLTAAGVPNADTITAVHCGVDTAFLLEVETVDVHEVLAPGQGDLTRTVTALSPKALLAWGDDKSTPIYDALVRR